MRGGRNGFPLLSQCTVPETLSVVDLVQRNKTGQASCRGAFVAVMMHRPLLWSREKRLCSIEASRGAEAIPAQRERRSRRAYHPRSGKMRADLPPAASGGQGIRHATGTPFIMRTGVYGGRRGCRGACPSHPLPPAAQATRPGCRAAAAIQRTIKKKKDEATKPRCWATAAIQRKTKKKKGKKPSP